MNGRTTLLRTARETIALTGPKQSRRPNDLAPPSLRDPSHRKRDAVLANDGVPVTDQQAISAAGFVTEAACHRVGLRLAAGVVFALVGCLRQLMPWVLPWVSGSHRSQGLAH